MLVLQKQDSNGDKSTVYKLLRRDSFRLRCLNRWRANRLLSLLFFFFYCCCLLFLLPCVLVLFRRFPLALFGSSSCVSEKGKKALYGCEKRVIVFSFCLTPSYMLFADFITSQKSRENTRPSCNVSRFRENKVLHVCLCHHPSLTTRRVFFYSLSPFFRCSVLFFFLSFIYSKPLFFCCWLSSHFARFCLFCFSFLVSLTITFDKIAFMPPPSPSRSFSWCFPPACSF